MISQETINKVLEQTDIVDVISEFVTLRKAGVNYKGCCPFHNEKTASFVVSPEKNCWHCFGCGKGGTTVSFIMEHEGKSYPDAIKWLAARYHIDIQYESEDIPEAKKKERQEREELKNCMKFALEFYKNILHSDLADAKAALTYANNRWNCKRTTDLINEDRDMVSMLNIGYAPKGFTVLVNEVINKGWSLDLFEKAGLLKKREDGHFQDVFIDRVMIPIYDKFGDPISFTARTMGNNPDVAKYINTKNTPIFDKSRNLYGLNIAKKVALRQRLVYCVEGAPDAMKLQAVGIENTVAALGTAWTDYHFESLLSMFGRGGEPATICWIPDSDQKKKGELGPGQIAVMKNGRMAMAKGFRVVVREIPQETDGKKVDADSYIDSIDKLKSINEVDFAIWYASKVIDKKATVSELSEQIRDVCSILILVDNEMVQNAMIKTLADRYGNASLWNSARKEALKIKQEQEIRAQHTDSDKMMLDRYGFWPKGNCYMGAHGAIWSNFIMRPLFHIRDPYNSRRLYEIKNMSGQCHVIEMKEEEMNSLMAFKARIGSMGNYRWKAGPNELNSLGDYLYEETKTANEIVQLGWQKAGFWAWGNGIVYDGQFYKADEYGIVTIDFKKDDGTTDYSENYYLPAKSKLYEKEVKLYQFERKFTFDPQKVASISLTDWLLKLEDVFGENARIGSCFMIASMFKDIITGYTRNFPLLNLFGPKGTGKTEFGVFLMSFFISDNTPSSFKTTTAPSLAEQIANCSNAVIHIDEYKNSIDPVLIEMLKSMYDGIGRSRMNMDRDKKREMTRVDSAVIFSGQEMPTVDIALMSRVIYLTFNTTVHTVEEKKKFNDLAVIRQMGVQHLTNQILACRQTFQATFYDNYLKVLTELQDTFEVNGEQIEDRIWRNWSVLLATYRTLKNILNLPWEYEDMRKLYTEGIRRQNAEVTSNSDMGDFWSIVNWLYQNEFIFEGFDFMLRPVKRLKARRGQDVVERDYSHEPKKLLMLRPSKVIIPFMERARNIGLKTMSEASIRYYLKNTPGYIGIKCSVVKFAKGTKGVPEYAPPEMGEDARKKLIVNDNPWCYDYDVLAAQYDINLEIVADDGEQDSDFA